jgi:hypothetical protein
MIRLIQKSAKNPHPLTVLPKVRSPGKKEIQKPLSSVIIVYCAKNVEKVVLTKRDIFVLCPHENHRGCVASIWWKVY